MIHVAAIVAIETAFLVLASSSKDGIPLRAFVLTNMMLITVFGGIMLPAGVPQSNVGCIFYAFVLCGTMLMFRREGAQAAAKVVRAVTFNLIMLLALAVTMNAMRWDGDGAAAYHEVLSGTYRFSYASLLAFIIGQSLYAYLYARLQHMSVLSYYVINMIVVQAVDTLVFFPIAFGASALEILNIAGNGFVVKVAIGLMFAPFVVMLHHQPTADSNRHSEYA